ncbi:MAG: endolytic transglycosylase MltG, partial [Polyangiales bacterium]
MSRRRRARPKSRARLVGLVLGALVLIGTLLVSALLVVYPRRIREGRGRTFVVAIPENADARTVADLLHENEVVDEPRLFAIYLRVTGADDVFRHGEVLLSDRLRPEEVARRLRSDRDGVPVRVTVPEGFNRFDVARRLDAAGVCTEAAFLEASAEPPDGIDAPSAEGYLFPDTYELRTDADARAVVRKMVRNHRERTEALFERHADALERLGEELGMG